MSTLPIRVSLKALENQTYQFIVSVPAENKEFVLKVDYEQLKRIHKQVFVPLVGSLKTQLKKDNTVLQNRLEQSTFNILKHEFNEEEETQETQKQREKKKARLSWASSNPLTSKSQKNRENNPDDPSEKSESYQSDPSQLHKPHHHVDKDEIIHDNEHPVKHHHTEKHKEKNEGKKSSHSHHTSKHKAQHSHGRAKEKENQPQSLNETPHSIDHHIVDETQGVGKAPTLEEIAPRTKQEIQPGKEKERKNEESEEGKTRTRQMEYPMEPPRKDNLHDEQEAEENAKNYASSVEKMEELITEFPLFPKKTKISRNESANDLFIIHRLEEYFSILFNDFGFIFLEEQVKDMLHLSDDLIDTLKRTVVPRSYQNFTTLLQERKHVSRGRNIGWLLRENHASYHDETEAFTQIVHDNHFSPAWTPPEHWKNYIFFLVPGIFTGFYKHFIGYFNDISTFFDKNGIYFERLKGYSTFSSTRKNAVAIQSRVKHILLKERFKNHRIVFICHSKGGVDTLSSLCYGHFEHMERVAGCLFLQSPIGGSIFTSTEYPKFGSDIFASTALKDLSYNERRLFIQQHPIPKSFPFPILSIVSQMGEAVGPLQFTIRFTQKYGKGTDGLVCVEDAILPNGRAVVLPNLDHSDLVFSRLNFHATEVLNPLSIVLAGLLLIKV